MHDSLMTKEILFDYLRENPKARCRDVATEIGILRGTARIFINRAIASGELIKTEEGWEIHEANRKTDNTSDSGSFRNSTDY